MMTPCYKCENRHQNCHAECEKYQIFQKEREAFLDAKQKERLRSGKCRRAER